MADRYWGENIFSEYNVSGVLAASLLFSALIRTLAAKATPKKYAFTPRCQTSDRKVVDPKFKMLKNFICRSSIKRQQENPCCLFYLTAMFISKARTSPACYQGGHS